MSAFTLKPYQLREDMEIIGIDCHVHREIHQELFVVIERQSRLLGQSIRFLFVRKGLYTYITKRNTSERVFPNAAFTTILV